MSWVIEGLRLISRQTISLMPSIEKQRPTKLLSLVIEFIIKYINFRLAQERQMLSQKTADQWITPSEDPYWNRRMAFIISGHCRSFNKPHREAV